MYKIQTRYYKKIHQDLFLDDLGFIKSKGIIEEKDFKAIQNVALNNEFINLVTDDIEALYALNKLELESVNFEAFLEGYDLAISISTLEDVIFNLFNKGELSFWIATSAEKDFLLDKKKIVSELHINHNVSIETDLSDVLSVLKDLSNLLDERCIDTFDEVVEVEYPVIDYDNYSVIN